eukprot:TRINITY_DN10024_c0_g1_i1.p1 TRINITY_DN10024_c0_g1~~TRINITY_DN10024_c0_g1_i1.p1  ORF type:complete len:933 (-),score=279.47 TRINITY_DN10024_c0_g1_i1:19-2601(-)
MLHNRDKLRPADQETIKKLIEKHSGGDGEGGEEKKEARKKGKRKKESESDSSASSGSSEEVQKRKKKKVEKEAPKKEETPEEKAIRLESELLWKFKDNLNHFRPKELREILELNNQSSKGGADTLIERIAEGMAFGALPEGCGQEDCSGGHVFLERSSGKYKCTGHSSEWSKCIWEADTVEAKAWKIPKWIKEENDFFSTWKWQKRERAVQKSEIVRVEGLTETGELTEEAKKAERAKRKFFEIGSNSDSPFQGYNIAFCGKFYKTLTALKEIVTDLGGKYSAKVNPKVTHLVATQDAIDDEEDKVEDANKFDIPILSIDWIKDTKKKNQILDQKEYIIGGTDKAQSTLTREFSDPAEDEKREQEEQAKEKKVKLVMKGRAAVDPSAEQKIIDNYHVLDKGGSEIYNVVLNLTDILTNINSYYCLQLLEHDKEKKYIVFRKWGRVGTKVGGVKTEKFSSLTGARNSFEEVYLDKTGNEWEDRDDFKKKANKFFPIEIDYSNQDDDPLKKARMTIDDKASKLDKRVQNLVSLIFNLDLMEESLIAMEIDLKKMPLGKLSKQHIQKGYTVLTEIDTVLKNDGPKKGSDLLRLTNQFYTLIPHDFGMGPVTLINSLEVLQKKMKLMETLIDIEIATSLMKADGGEAESKIDANYTKLNTELVPLDKDHPDYQLVESYMNNQKGSFKLKLLDAFKVARAGEDARFQEAIPLGNRQLLWHGSRVSNYVGILSQGLRIAPPEAPKSGYRFGKGIYFADICEKSAHYCRGSSGGKDTILMMLVDVALGKMAELKKDQYMEEPLPGFNSTKALGGIAPVSYQVTEEGVTVPLGPIGKTGIKSACTHNEFIVYTVKQACIRYLLKIELE